jgi:tetratricopeptide (TPR) repeat protein
MKKVCAGIFFVLVLPTIFWLPAPVPAQNAEVNTYVRLVKKGSEQIKTGDYDGARSSFEEALRYYDTDPSAHLGLGLAYFHLHDDKYAERELTRVSELKPDMSEPYQWLGEIYYRKDDLESAVSYWEKAVELNPSASNLKARLDRIKKEHQTEKDFNRDVTSHFLIKYEGREKIEAGRIILRILEEAYSDVGRSLSFYPDQEIQVILYSGQQFQEVTDAPGWSGGIYDGKIRIPIGGIEKETEGLRGLLYHEYTHAVVRAVTRSCPTWLNEGLAQYFQGREIGTHQKELMRKMAEPGKAVSLSGLSGSFTSLNSHQAQVAYLLSLSAVRHMVDSYGMYRVKSVLDELGNGADITKAISTSLSLSYEEFELGWKRALE